MLSSLPRLKILFVVVCFSSNLISAQTTHLLPPNQPEQDACNALVLCGNSFYTPYSYQLTGKKVDLASTPCSASFTAEFNSVWFRLNVNTAGKLVFKIIPVDTINDYDFAVVNATGKDCNNLSTDDVVRCNYNNNLKGSNPGGIIGLSTNSNTPYVEVAAFGNSFCQAIDAAAGDSYLIMINNAAANESGGGGALSGFTLDFTGSSASFNNGVKPDLSAVDVPCGNAKSINIQLNTEILCSSVAADGSDFTCNAPVNIISAEGINCSGNSGYTNTITLHFSSALPAGNYIMQATKGNDGNTLLSLCNNALVLPSKQIPFTISSSGIEVTENKFICSEELPYTWNGITVMQGSDHAAVYTTLSSGGCDSTTTLNLTVGAAPAQRILSQTICSYQSYTLPWIQQ